MNTSRIRIFPVMLLSLSLATTSGIADELGAAGGDLPEKKSVVWQNDPLCQFVFFAVLEGLYRDGVQDEVVDAILGEEVNSLNKDSKIKHCFVFKCDLCHAVFEAFSLYRARPAFKNVEGKVSFGNGVDEGILKDLTGEDTRARVYAMGSLIRPWIQHRVEMTRMTEQEKATMKERFVQYAKEGAKRLSMLRRDDILYVDWNFYGSCQACEASKDFE